MCHVQTVLEKLCYACSSFSNSLEIVKKALYSYEERMFPGCRKDLLLTKFVGFGSSEDRQVLWKSAMFDVIWSFGLFGMSVIIASFKTCYSLFF